MDRQIVYAGAIPLETDLLNTNKYTMIGLAKLASAIMGSSTYVRGLSCTPSSPASMIVNVSAGEIYSLQNVDGTAYSSLAADTTHSVLKQGIVMDSTAFTLTAPGTSGYSINYLIQATYNDTDSGATVLPYYNASNPSVAWSGPNNSGTAQNTVRSGVCTLSLKAGVAATTGTQVTPTPDTGFTGLYVVTVAQGATTVTASNISIYANAPFIPSTGIVDGIQKNTLRIATDSGTANTYVLSVNPGISTLTYGMELIFRATNANTGAATINLSGLGAFPVLNQFGATLTSGEIGAGSLCRVMWSSSASSWMLMESTGGVPTVPTAAANISNTQAASTGFVHSAVTGITGDARNLRMAITTASATATLTADEVIVATSQGGQQYRVSGVSATINVGTTGAGGMDTGTVPTPGFVGIYLIYNPTTQATALLAVNATSAAATNVYSGANMPAGYTASALVSVWRTYSGVLAVGDQMGRDIATADLQFFSSTTQVPTLTALDISGFIPKNAKKMEGYGIINGTTVASNNSFSVSSRSVSIGSHGAGANNSGLLISFSNLIIAETQRIYYSITSSSTISGSSIYTTGYSF